MSAHLSIQDSVSTLPASNGDRDYEQEFDAPGLTGGPRPYLLYKANPASGRSVQLQMQLNGVTIVNQSLDTDVSRSFHEIFDEGVLRAQDNTLRVLVPNSDPGSVEVSDLVLVYATA